jgi:ribulose-phosphate 3-epimerase
MSAPPPAAPKVAARVLCAQFPCLGHEVSRAVRAGADWIHADVMDDGPSLRSAPLACAALHRVTRAPVDVHLMVKPTDAVLSAFARAGADLVTFHPEATEDVRRTVLRAKALGLHVGVALSPVTPLSLLDDVLDDVDVVVMTVASDGLAGARFPPEALARMRAIRARIAARGRSVAVEVDGGVGPANAAEVIRAGADVLVAGSALFGTGDYAAMIAALKGLPAPVRRARGGQA